MSFPLEDLSDYEILMYLERLDDEMLYAMCTQPISKRISKVCRMNGTMSKELYVRIMKHMLSDPETETSLVKAVLYSDHNKYNYDPDPQKFAMWGDSWEEIIYSVQKFIKRPAFIYRIYRNVVYTDERVGRQRSVDNEVLKTESEEEVIKFFMDKYEKGFKILDPNEEPFKFNDQGNPMSIEELNNYLNSQYAIPDSESSEESE